MSTPQEPTEEQLLEALRRVKVDDVVLQTVATLVNLAGQKLTVPEAKDPVEAKKAIDAARAMLPLTPGGGGRPDQGRARAGADAVRARDGRSRAPGAACARARSREQSSDEAERAKARSKIWTPGS